MNIVAIGTLAVGAWCIINGLLHDIFVLRSDYGKKYDRELLRLLMDGHALITCGAIQVVSYFGLQHNAHWAYATAGIATVSLLVYCAMIWPFLKSVVTILLNAVLLGLLVYNYLL
jgi:uncharacterized membrane protein HdeD (DUF308 family)